jgi:purine-binding chemotaxis protein CheW
VPVGEESYAVDAEHVVEVASDPSPTRVPGAPPTVVGVVNVRGEVVPLFDTAALLALDASAIAGGSDGIPFAVVVRCALGPAALTATSMPEVATLDDLLGPSDLANAATRYRLGTRLVVLIDVEALLATARGGPAPGDHR